MADIDQVVVINDFAEPEGGAGILALECMKQYRRLGYPVTLLTGEGRTPELDALGVSVHGLEETALLKTSRLKGFQQGLHNGRAKTLISGWIAANDTPRTVYHMHNWSQILSPAVYAALRPVEARTIVTCHDFFNVCPNGGFLHFGHGTPCQLKPLSPACLMSQCDRRSAAHKFWRVLRHQHLNSTARFAENKSSFVFIHERMRQKFLASGFEGQDLSVIPNPVEPWSRERIRAEENSDFLFVGRVGRDKGADLAIEATRLAGQRLTLVGTGEMAVEAAGGSAHTTFAGWRKRSEIRQFAARARALIVPSRVIESFGLVICEAALSGLPVIVSDRAYLAADVEAGGFGRQFDVADVSSLARIVGEFARDDTMVAAMSRRAFDKGWSMANTPESWIEAYLDLFQKKLADRAERKLRNAVFNVA